jgi:hypothetical protein
MLNLYPVPVHPPPTNRRLKMNVFRAKRCIGMLPAGLFLLTGPVFAQPGSGIWVGDNTVLLPEIQGSAGYNDNVNLRRRALGVGGEDLNRKESDSFFEGRLSLGLRHLGDMGQYNARGWISAKRYDENSELDGDTFGASLGFLWLPREIDLNASLNVSYEQATDRSELADDAAQQGAGNPEFENVAERVERDQLRVSGSLTRQLTHRLRTTAGFSILDVDYADERFNDRTSQLYQVELAYALTDFTAPYLRAGLGRDRDQGFADTAERNLVLFGFRYNPADAIQLDLAAGYESFRRTPYLSGSGGRAAGEEEKDSQLKFQGILLYTLNHQTRISLSAMNGYGSVASARGNAREELSATVSLSHQTTPQIGQRVSVSWREDSYLAPLFSNGESFDEVKETLWYQYRIDYQTVRPWLSLFANLSYEDGSSKIPNNDYTETQILIGLTARY